MTLAFSALQKPIFITSDSFLWSITLPDFIFPHRPRPSGIGGAVGFFIRSSYRPHKIESPFCQSFENMVVSIGLHGRSLLLAYIYHPPGRIYVICWFPIIY